jgi:hypothetical protein
MTKFYDIITREAEMFDGSPEMCEKYGIMRLESKISSHYTRIVYAIDGWQPAIGDYLEKNSVAVSAIPLRLRDNELPVVPSCVDRYIRDRKNKGWDLSSILSTDIADCENERESNMDDGTYEWLCQQGFDLFAIAWLIGYSVADNDDECFV